MSNLTNQGKRSRYVAKVYYETTLKILTLELAKVKEIGGLPETIKLLEAKIARLQYNLSKERYQD